MLESIQLGNLPGVGMTVIDGVVRSERSRNTPPAGPRAADCRARRERSRERPADWRAYRKQLLRLAPARQTSP